MKNKKVHLLALKLARKMIDYHNTLVLKHNFGGRKDKLTALLFKTHPLTMAEALICAEFKFDDFCKIFTKEKVFCGFAEKPHLDAVAEVILTQKGDTMFKDVLADHKDMINMLGRLSDRCSESQPLTYAA
tara:strand:+ start:9792 stop:10181 length:390 start_codon:yes stop_codon:yes gene_type:complete